MANPVGALFSLIGGLDTGPSQVRNQSVAEKQRLGLELRKMMTGDKFARDELASNVGIANKQMEGVDRRFDREIEARKEEGDVSRSQERTIQEMRQRGRVDLQELIGSQQASMQAEQQTLAQLLQRDSQEFQAQQQLERLTATGGEAAKMLDENKRQFDADLAWKQRNGKHEEAINAVSLRLATLQAEMAERQNAQLPTDEEVVAQKEYRKQIEFYALEEMKLKYAGRMSPDMLQKLNQLQLQLGEAELEGKKVDTEGKRTDIDQRKAEGPKRVEAMVAETDLTKATTEQKKLETKIVKDKMLKGEEDEKEKAAPTAGAFTPADAAQRKNLQRQAQAREKGLDFKPLGSVSGTEAAIKAYDALEAEGENDTAPGRAMQSKLRRAAALLEKAGDHAMDREYWLPLLQGGGGLPGVATAPVKTLWNFLDAVFGPDWTLDEAETGELSELMSELNSKYGIDLVE